MLVLILIVFVACMSISFYGENPGRPGEPTLLQVLAPGFFAFLLLSLVAIGVTLS